MPSGNLGLAFHNHLKRGDPSPALSRKVDAQGVLWTMVKWPIDELDELAATLAGEKGRVEHRCWQVLMLSTLTYFKSPT